MLGRLKALGLCTARAWPLTLHRSADDLVAALTSVLGSSKNLARALFPLIMIPPTAMGAGPATES
jgi:hypothetical protein